MEPIRLAHSNRTQDPPAQLTDEILLAGLGRGDAALSLALVQRFQRAVFGVAVFILRDQAAAERVARETFQRAARHAALYDARCGSVRGWLSAMARDLAVAARPAAAGLPEDLPARLAAMPAGPARAVLLAGVFGMCAQRIAAAEGTDFGTARDRVQAGLGGLRSARLRVGGS